MTNKKSPTGDKDKSGYTYADFDETRQFAHRRCSVCGNATMKPVAEFVSSGLAGENDRGQQYACPNCGKNVLIADSGALFMGGVFALFWIAVGSWAFYSGPYWYLTHMSYFSGQYEFDLMLLDGLFIIFSLAVIAFSLWVVWLTLLQPGLRLARHPKTTDSRPLSQAESEQQSSGKHRALFSFFVFPVLLWIPILLGMWILSLFGWDPRDNEMVNLALLPLFLALVFAGSKYFRLNGGFAFVGMAMWMALFVAFVFYMAG